MSQKEWVETRQKTSLEEEWMNQNKSEWVKTYQNQSEQINTSQYESKAIRVDAICNKSEPVRTNQKGSEGVIF